MKRSVLLARIAALPAASALGPLLGKLPTVPPTVWIRFAGGHLFRSDLTDWGRIGNIPASWLTNEIEVFSESEPGVELERISFYDKSHIFWAVEKLGGIHL